MDLATALRWTAERHPTRRAVGGEHPLTYREWAERTGRLAGALAERGVRHGDRVALLLAGGEPLASLHLAVQQLGATAAPLSTRLGSGELAYCLDDCGPRLLVTDDTTAGRATDVTEVSAAELASSAVDATPPPPVTVSETDTSLMLYTSGTTGRPKGVPRSHRAEHSAAVAHVIQTQQRPGEVTLGVMPMFHTMGMRTLLASIVVGGTWVPQARFDADEALALIERDAVSSLYLVPTLYWSLLQTGRLGEARSVRRLAYAGAAMTPALAEQLAGALDPEVFVNHFGSTEIYTFTIGPDVVAKPGSAGRAGCSPGCG